MESKVILAELVASREDFGGYIVYVFNIIDGKLPYDKYIMCTRFPNWDSPTLNLGDVGYLKYREVDAGIDKWFDGTNFIPYKYTGVHFLDFVYKKNKDELLTL